MTVRRVAELDFATVTARAMTPSPSAWEDEVLYFLLVDRFSDGREDGYRGLDGQPVAGTTPPFQPADNGNAIGSAGDAERWRLAGVNRVGGTLAGVRSKIGYLRRLGVSTLWISPVLKQSVPPAGEQSNYHGYATQDFLAVEPAFGTDADLAALVDAAHAAGLRVILDVVLNHAGDVFAYDLSDPTRYPATGTSPITPVDPRWDGAPYPVAGWRSATGGIEPFTPAAAAALWPDGAVSPAELQDAEAFSRKGRISDWDHSPEYLDGDFIGLKDIAHGGGPLDDYRPSPALRALTRAYCWWIAFADLDGFRVDTVKHMDRGATRYFSSVVHEFAQSIGKDRFLLVGEITGSRPEAVATMQLTGLDAALGLADVQQQLNNAATGAADPVEYFSLFRNSELIGKDSHTWLRNTVVTSFDDHDQVRQGGTKSRFGAITDGRARLPAIAAMNATTLGIPCFYYGTEQHLDGSGGGTNADRYIREALFGGEFGPFRSRDRHLFDESSDGYRVMSGLFELRRREPALRRGRQYLRQISGDGSAFGLPTGFGGPLLGVIGWSRILADREVLCLINTDPAGARQAWVTVDAGLHRPADTLRLLHATTPGPPLTVGVEQRNGMAVQVSLPAAGFAAYA
ncbi:alpha-amylase family glycosyl hydrolase [Nakamurella sp. GG22]